MHSLRSGVMALLVVASVGLLSWAQQPDPRQQPDPNSQPNPKTQLPPTFQPGTNPQQPGQPPAGGGYLGVMLNPEAQPGANGIEVMQVMPDSPAAKVGLQNGDRITKVGDKQVTDVNQFLQTIGSHKPGDKFTVVVMRGGKEQNIAVTVGQRPANMGYGMQQPGSFPQFPNTYPQQTSFPRAAFIGVQAQWLTPEVKERLKVTTDTGVVITDVMPNSPAAQAGLNRDDVITAINDHPIKTPDDLRNAIQSAGSGKEITLQVLRGTKTVSLKATPRDGGSGMMPTQGMNRIPPTNLGYGQDQSRQIQELEHRVAELEKKIQQLEKK